MHRSYLQIYKIFLVLPRVIKTFLEDDNGWVILQLPEKCVPLLDASEEEGVCLNKRGSRHAASAAQSIAMENRLITKIPYKEKNPLVVMSWLYV